MKKAATQEAGSAGKCHQCTRGTGAVSATLSREWRLRGDSHGISGLRVRDPQHLFSPGHLHDHKRLNFSIALPCRLQG